MALSKVVADALQQKLYQNYDQAVSGMYIQGSRLGFSAILNRVFYIDKNVSRSVKLED